MTEPEPTMTVYVLNGTRTSAGPGPGPMTLPASECSALISMKFAVPGSRAPNEGDPEPTARRFGGPVPPSSWKQHSN
jgi:hypothetical protein